MRKSFLFLACSILSGCALGPNFKPDVPGEPADSYAATRPTGSQLVAQPVPPDWWDSFNDPILSALEQQAVEQNLDLQAAALRVAESRAQLRIAGASGLPSASANASYMRERASPKGILSLLGSQSPAPDSANGASPFGSTTVAGSNGSPAYDLFQLGFDASWEIDLWGKARRLREAARADTQSAIYDREAARVTLTAEVAKTYMALRGAEAKLEVIRSNRDTVARGLMIAEHREAEGAATKYDTATAAAQLSTIEASIPSLVQQIATFSNALALLIAAPPHALDEVLSKPAEVPVLPDLVPVGLPSELAERRPDIASAEAALHAATARIGVAKANFYPSISLTGSFGTQGLDISNIPGWGARQYLVGPVMKLPIFQGGRLRGELELTKADQQIAALHYRETVLKAWHEVDDALTAFKTEQDRRDALSNATEQSRVAVAVAERRYREGATAYLSVLIAERSLLSNEADLADSRTASASAMIALYKALGGGWTPPTGKRPS